MDRQTRGPGEEHNHGRIRSEFSFSSAECSKIQNLKILKNVLKIPNKNLREEVCISDTVKHIHLFL